MTSAVTDSTFEAEVLGASEPVVVDFWAEWCGPCKMIAPHLEQLSGELSGKVKIVKLNTDENQQTAGRFRIDSIPTMLVFRNGELIDRLVGLLPKEQIARRLASLI